MTNKIRIADLFAGIGGIRLGLEQALKSHGYAYECVFTSEIKPYAVDILKQNNPNETISGDITSIDTKDIPNFDILCAGFPCQPFSYAGNLKGFGDTRGTLFFEIERILADKKPFGFILENVNGLVTHNHGKTLSTIIGVLEYLGYSVSYSVLNSRDFGLPQDRKRIYIVGVLKEYGIPNLCDFDVSKSKLSDILEHGKKTSDLDFVKLLLKNFGTKDLEGKTITDKRGGDSNIHSWDLGIKGEITKEEKTLMELIILERRKKKWANEIGIDWMDGMPLTISQISTFYDNPNLQHMLDDLVSKGYLAYEYPKKLVTEYKTLPNGDTIPINHREYDEIKEKGYNIVTGKLSFDVNKILDSNGVSPTIVATDVDRLYVVDGDGIRQFTLREGLRLFGYPEDFKFNINKKDGFDLLGNTVSVPVIKAVADRLIELIPK